MLKCQCSSAPWLVGFQELMDRFEGSFNDMHDIIRDGGCTSLQLARLRLQDSHETESRQVNSALRQQGGAHRVAATQPTMQRKEGSSTSRHDTSMRLADCQMKQLTPWVLWKNMGVVLCLSGSV